mgnify:CR=1 FL=1
MDKRIYLCLAHMSGKEQDFIREAFDTNWVVPLGPNVNAFEEDLKHFVGQNKEVVALSAGTAAIHLGLIQLGVSTGDEVICQSFTFCASANPVAYQGATPVFIDSEEDTWNMDPALLEEAIKDRIAKTGKKPKAILPVHLYGMPARIDEICAIASKYDIPVLEDAAEALGSEFKGQKCGTFGTFGVLSFNGNKMITTSGGGALIVPDEAAKKQTMFYATQAREPFPHYQHEKIGYNYRMSNVVAGVVRGQFPYLDEHIAQKKAIYERYKEGLKDLPVSMNPMDLENSEPNYWLSCLIVDEDAMCKQVRGEQDVCYVKEAGKTCPTEILEAIASINAEGRPIWKPMHMQPIYRLNPFVVRDGNGRARSNAYIAGGAADVGMDIFARGLCLPSDNKMTAEQQDRIIEVIRACFE